jgi:8-oxo-dGTP diphosphatase
MTGTMQLYVCGFLFSVDRSRVLLIRKRKPVWQAGKLNGVGGKIEAGETPLQAMVREFEEEAGLRLKDWTEVVTLRGEPTPADPAGWRGHFFRGFGDLTVARAMTAENLEIHPTYPLPRDTISNLHWLIPLLLDDEVVHARKYRVEVGGKGSDGGTERRSDGGRGE